MKIEHIQIQNFRRIAEFDAKLAPLSMVCGSNGVGKTSIARALKFAFDGDKAEAGKGKDASGLLLHGDAENGVVTLSTDIGTIARDVATGKALGQIPNLPVALPYVLRGEDFTKPETDRRAVLFSVMKLSAGPEEIIKRLAAKSVNKAYIDAVKHLLPGGCPPAVTEAERKGREAKGAWHEVTGENYGSKKGETWAAPSPGFSQEEYDEIQQDLKDWAAIIETKTRLVGEGDAYDKAQQELPALREKAKTHVVESGKVQQLRKQHNALKEELEALGPSQSPQGSLIGGGGGKAHLEPPPNVLQCPHCSKDVVFKIGKLIAYVKQEAPKKQEAKKETSAEDEATKKRREAIVQEMADLARQITAGDAKVKEADAAAIRAGDLEKAEQRPELASAQQELADAKEGLKECQEAERGVNAAKLATEQAEAKTARAKELHTAVARWEALGAALSSIPGEIMKSALGPLDAELKASAEATGWPLVRLDEDMEVWCGKYTYKMTSESYQWRANLMLSVALARLSGVNLVLADRFDVLSLKGRAECLNWLLDMALDDNMQFIVFATLKAPPAAGEGMAVFWLGDDEAAQAA